MSKGARSFVDKCLAGDAFAHEMDDFIDKWHEGGEDQELHEFLGMTEQEYDVWVERPESLSYILFARRHEMRLAEALQLEDDYAVAARASTDEARKLVIWLKRTGRIPK